MRLTQESWLKTNHVLSILKIFHACDMGMQRPGIQWSFQDPKLEVL